MRGDDSRWHTVFRVVVPVALAFTILGGVVGAIMVDQLTDCDWYSGAWVPLAVATGLYAPGIAAVIVSRELMGRFLIVPLIWATLVSGALIVFGWMSYADEYAGCPD